MVKKRVIWIIISVIVLFGAFTLIMAARSPVHSTVGFGHGGDHVYIFTPAPTPEPLDDVLAGLTSMQDGLMNPDPSPSGTAEPYAAGNTFGSSLVTHRGTDVEVDFRGSKMDAQQAISTFWSSVKAGTTALEDKCILFRDGSTPTVTIVDDVTNLASEYPIPAGATGHNAMQVIVTLDGVTMNVDNAVRFGIAKELSRVYDNIVHTPCHSYCYGNKLMLAGSCDSPANCGAGYGTSYSDCPYGCTNSLGPEPNGDAITGAACNPPPGLANGDLCGPNSPNAGQPCQSGNCFDSSSPPDGIGRCV